MSTNPYATPKAAVADESVVLDTDFVPGGQPRPIGHGWTWIADSWELFKRQPALWIGMGVVLIAIFIGAAFVGVAGQLASSLLWPVFAAGMAIAARALDSGGEMEFGHLFAGFHTRTAALIAVGALYLAVYLAVVLLVSQATGIPMLVLLGAEPQTDVDPRMVLLAVLTVLALLLPVFMAVWFAAPLIVFHQHGALEAMKGSFAGCVKNILPFLWYGVIGMLLGIVASLPVLLGWLVLWPVFMASVYTGYRDIYLKPRARAGS